MRPGKASNVGTAVAECFDLRSDFISRPTEGMVEAMVAASAETPGIGFREDPVVSRLEALSAELLGKEDALFCPTYTLCNQIAINASCQPGDVILAPHMAHALISEGGAPAALSGAQAEIVETERGAMLPAALEAALARKAAGRRPRVGLIVMENTHVHSGGCAVPEDTMKAVAELATAHGVPVHLDGSRLFNAAAFLSVEVTDLTRHADTVAISLNKGLSAPVSAVLAGTAERIAEAVDICHRFGGGRHRRPRANDRVHGRGQRQRPFSGPEVGGDRRRFGDQRAGGDQHTLHRRPPTGFRRRRLPGPLGPEGHAVLFNVDGSMRAVLHKDITSAHIDSITRAFEEAL